MGGAQCPENERLLNLFGDAVDELLMLQEQQFIALINGYPDVERFEILILAAREQRQAAKHAYLSHLEEHGCEVRAQDALAELGSMRARRSIERAERRKRNEPSMNRRRRLMDLAM